VALKIQDFLHCLAMTESNDDPDAPLRDGGRALGRFQIHPDAMDTMEKRFGIRPALNETWDSFLTRLVTAFVGFYQGQMSDIEVAMYFHLGHHARPTDDDWDKEYQQRFEIFVAEIGRAH